MRYFREHPEEAPAAPREFSREQERIIESTMKVCIDARCDGPDHKEHD